MLQITRLISDVECYAVICELRWADGLICCPHCGGYRQVHKRGHHSSRPQQQRYFCVRCHRGFDDLTGTILAKHHQPVKAWILCLYLMDLNLSNAQIAQELDVCASDIQEMTEHLRQGIVTHKPPIRLTGEVECDEVYLVAGHKGQPVRVRAQGRAGRRRRLKGTRGRGTLAKEKPPIFGMLQHDGQVVLRMLPDVQQKTIQPVLQTTVTPGTLLYTDEYNIYNRVTAWGYAHKTVCHSAGEYARDEDGDGFCEAHVNTLEGLWSPLRSWLRPHRGISQPKLPLYLGFFEFIHNVRQRGKALLAELLRVLLSPISITSLNPG